MRAAVIGAGLIAKQHLGALANCPDVEVVGVCDASPITAEATADRFGIESWFTDYRRLLDEERPQVVHVLTPAATHFAIARDCLQFGAHVLVEKPIALELGQLEELLAVADAQRKWIVEDHNYRFNRDVQYMLAQLHAGRFGQIRHVDIDICVAMSSTSNRAADSSVEGSKAPIAAGPVVEFLTHLCYLAHLFIGEHRRVTTSWRQTRPGELLTTDNFQALVDGQWGTARLGFSTDSQPDCFNIRVQGTRLQMQTNLFEVGTVRTALLAGPKPLIPIRNMLSRSRAELFNAARSMRRKLRGAPGPYEGLWELVRRYYAGLATGTEPPVSTTEIVAVNRLFHAILEEAPASCAS
jgi:predicted dehydrogenase